jgi:hypothetical protein
MAGANWRFVLTNQQFVPVGEILNADERQVSILLNKLDTASFKMRLDNPLVDLIAANASGYIKGYRNGVLRFYGPIISGEEVGDSTTASFVVNSASPGWIFTKRYIGKSSTGNATYATVATDRGQIVGGFLDALNLEDDTHIQRGEIMTSASAITYIGGPYAFMSACIAELSNSFDGFDWRIDPIDNFSGGVVTGSKIGALTTDDVIGIDQPDAVFEWGCGRYNMASYQRSVNRETQANSVFHNASAGPDAPGYPTINHKDLDSIAEWGLMEDVAVGDLTLPDLRTGLAMEHVAIRRQPRKIINFVPHVDDGTGRVPSYGDDYVVGDRVRGRGEYNGVVRFDGVFRVYGVQFTIDKNGVERVSLTLEDSD